MNKTLPVCLCLIASTVCADPVRMDVSGRDCFRLMTSSAEYVPGVSVTGQAVAPADLNGGTDMPLPDLDDMTLPVYVDLERNFPFWDSELEAGVIPVARVDFKDGWVFVNGKPVSRQVQAVLKEECRKSFENRRDR